MVLHDPYHFSLSGLAITIEFASVDEAHATSEFVIVIEGAVRAV